MENIVTQLTPLFRFFKRPYYTFPHHPISFTNKIIQLIGLVLLMIIVDIILIPFISLIDASSKFEIPAKHGSLEYWARTLFITVIAFPFVEELIFRYHLKFVKGGFIFYVALITTLLLTFIVKIIPPKTAAIVIFILLCVILVLIAITLLKPDNQYHYQSLFMRYFPYHVWFSTILFAAVHLFNNHYHTSLAIALSPLLVLPQFFGGMILSYARLKYGIFSSMFIHGFHNLIVTLILFYSDNAL